MAGVARQPSLMLRSVVVVVAAADSIFL